MDNTAGPTIFKSPDLQQTTSELSKNPKGFFRKNLILVIVAILVLAVAGYGAYSYFSPQSGGLKILGPQVNELRGAQLSLMPEKSAYKQGENVVIDVKLYTGGQSTQSTDVVVKYDPQFLQPVVDGVVTPGQIYSEYPPIQVEEKQGLIGMSGITADASGQGFSGVGSFAKLNFVALKDGQTEVLIEYQPDQTSDSNVLLFNSMTDVLSSVDSTTLTISPTPTEASSTLPQSCGSFTQYCEDSTGRVGTQMCNTGTMSNGVCGYNPWLTNSCEACTIK